MAPFSAPEGDGLGLFVRPPGRQRRISLLDDRGALTGAGKYFFQQRKQAALTREFGQSPPVIEGRRAIKIDATVDMGEGEQTLGPSIYAKVLAAAAGSDSSEAIDDKAAMRSS